MDTTPAATGLAALRVNGVSKRFGHTVALDAIDLELRAGELLALVGPSGCGKSTLLRVVAGLVPADTGTVWLAGTLVDDGDHHLPPERRHVGLVFQEHALFPHLTVAANVGFGLGRRERAARDGRVDETLALVGLPGHRDRYPHELSGGERQRVALARALAPRPALMLLDEPFASLDPNLRTQVRTDVVRILREAATPAVFVTHDQSEALALGDRVAVMRAGLIQHLATPWEVFHMPANRFVAAFMGEASFLDLHGDGPVRTTEFGPVAVGSPNGEGQRVVAMVRPDDVAFDVDPDGDAVIIATEFRGSSWCYRIRLASGSTVLADVSHLVQADVGTRVRTRLATGHRPVVVPDTT